MLTIQNLRKTFSNSENEKFDIINIPFFEMNNNEQIAIIGESGSGKSTFLNLISGIVSSDSGEILFNDTNITKLSGSKMEITG